MTDRKAEKLKVKEITDKLEKGLKELFESKQYMDYLTTMSKFHRYSYHNALLIVMQNPSATLLAGYKSWQKNFNRYVKKGEVGISILAPVTHRVLIDSEDDKHESEIRVTSFRIVTVFDVSQTEGDPIPTLGVDELSSAVDGYSRIFNAILSITTVPVTFEHIPGKSKGYFSSIDNRIALREGMSESQTLKTLIHEAAHTILHNSTQQIKDQRTREVEAESIAYTVLQHFGIDTSEYSFGYIAGWSSDKNTKELKSSLRTIQKTSSEFITAIEDHLANSAKTTKTTGL